MIYLFYIVFVILKIKAALISYSLSKAASKADENIAYAQSLDSMCGFLITPSVKFNSNKFVMQPMDINITCIIVAHPCLFVGNHESSMGLLPDT